VELPTVVGVVMMQILGFARICVTSCYNSVVLRKHRIELCLGFGEHDASIESIEYMMPRGRAEMKNEEWDGVAQNVV
jgi:hypothetical protein